MRRNNNYSSLLQIVALIFMLLFFIWENRNISPDDQLVLLILFSVAIIVVPSMFGYIYLKDRLDRIKVHEEEISKLKKDAEKLKFKQK